MTLPSGIQFKTPINCILLHEFPLIYKILAFTTFFPSHFHKKLNNFKKISGHTCRVKVPPALLLGSGGPTECTASILKFHVKILFIDDISYEIIYGGFFKRKLVS